MVDSDNDTPRSMSDVEDNDRVEPDSSVMDGVREAANGDGLEGSDTEDAGQQLERESSGGPGSVTMVGSTEQL